MPCNCEADSSIPWKDITDVIIALVNLALVYYIFVYQREKDKGDRKTQLKLTAAETKINWLRELIITPNIDKIYKHFDALERESAKLSAPNLNLTAKIAINDSLKKEIKGFSGSFFELLVAVEGGYYHILLELSDKYIDELSENIFDNSFHLSNRIEFHDKVEIPLIKYKKDFFSTIYHFMGFEE